MTPVERGYEILEWDSGVFGFNVARAAIPDDSRALTAALEDARRNDVRLVYLHTDDSQLVRAAESLGGTLVGERVTFARTLTAVDAQNVGGSNAPVVVEQWPGTVATPELLQLSRAAGLYSRFRIDSRVPEGVFERIYDAWITRSLERKIAEEVLVTRDALSISGLVTLGAKDGRADIGLLAVRADARGRGLGKALVLAALDWAIRRQFREAQVVTQQANIEACRLYEACGYAIERKEWVLHFWL